MDNYYSLLKIETSATEDEIKAAYRDAVRLYHPDSIGDEGSKKHEELLNKIMKGYQILTNPHKRADYDRSLLAKDPSIVNYRFNKYNRTDGMQTSEDQEPLLEQRLKGRSFFEEMFSPIIKWMGLSDLFEYHITKDGEIIPPEWLKIKRKIKQCLGLTKKNVGSKDLRDSHGAHGVKKATLDSEQPKKKLEKLNISMKILPQEAEKGAKQMLKVPFEEGHLETLITIPKGTQDGSSMTVCIQVDEERKQEVEVVFSIFEELPTIMGAETYRKGNHLYMKIPIHPSQANEGGTINVKTTRGVFGVDITSFNEGEQRVTIKGQGYISTNSLPGDLNLDFFIDPNAALLTCQKKN